MTAGEGLICHHELWTDLESRTSVQTWKQSLVCRQLLKRILPM